ncbi:MAG: FKBP-type peptidyl-prolyl cis-trans isomerase [Bacteroidales bacterium]
MIKYNLSLYKFILFLCFQFVGLLLLAQTPLSTYTSDIRYRICKVGKSQIKVQEHCHVQLYLSCRTLQGKVFFRKPYWIFTGDIESKNNLQSALTLLGKGDSAEFIAPLSMLQNAFLNVPVSKKTNSNEAVVIAVRVLRVVEPDVILDYDYEDFCNQYVTYENTVINNYLASPKGKDFKRNQGGYWQRQFTAGNGKKATKAGDVVLVAYQGRFLNGLVFDKGAKKNEPFRYVRGVQWQMVSGLAVLMGQMSEGEKATVILPSKMAFGIKGLADIVPPYTPVMYDVEVLEIKVKK